MDELLTAREVQEILKVDRITIYRMLNDGRLKGAKIGQQWRFSRSDVERLLGNEPPAEEPLPPEPNPSFPTHCVQTIQDLFSDVSQISALIVDTRGRAADPGQPSLQLLPAHAAKPSRRRKPVGLPGDDCQASQYRQQVLYLPCRNSVYRRADRG